MIRGWLACATLVCAVATAAYAQADHSQIKVLSGHDARVGVYADIRPNCTSGPLPAIRLTVPPAHGIVTVKRGMLKATNFKQCLATEVPAFVTIYRSAVAYIGADEFTLEISWPNGHKEIRRVWLDVSNAPAKTQGI